jgi:hypothetical protein
MKSLFNFLWVITGLFCSQKLTAQSAVAVEQIQSYSIMVPTSNYWHIPSNVTGILETLDTGLFADLHLVRDKSINPVINNINKQNQIGKLAINWSKTTHIPFHAYIEWYEMMPEFAYQNKLINIADSKKDSIASLWFITINIFNQKQEAVFKKTLLMNLIPQPSFGMGFTFEQPASTPNSIIQALQKGISLFSADLDDLLFVEAKVPTAYATDNFWMPLIQGKVRIPIDTNKQFSTYVSTSGVQLLRTPTAIMNKINYKDKSPNNPYINLIPIIKKRSNYFDNEYYEVTQTLRDVNNNKDYSLLSFIEFNTHSSETGNLVSPIIFLPDSIHSIYQDRDSIGYFSVEENVKEKDKFFNANEIWNGYDSTKKINLGTLYEKKAIISAKVINGRFKQQLFSIHINYVNNLKTIYINGQVSMIVQGKNKPYQMVEVTPVEDIELKNFLLMMSFSEIFQLPI